LLAVSSSTALLATTRQRLGVPGEMVVAVPSLDHRGGPAAPAIELFIERARAANPGFAPVDQDRFTIGEICAHLDGMPLAIELAAARVSVLTPAEILDRMGDRFRLLSGGRGRHRRRTLQATLDWSYDLLDPEEQRFFARLGLFVGSFDLSATVAVSEMDDYDAMDVLESLVAKNLVVPELSAAVDSDQAEGTATRYRLLETVRIYAGDQLARSEEASAALALYVGHYRTLAHAETLAEAASLERAIALRWQWPNISSTLEHLTEAGEWEAAADVVFGIQGMWDTPLPASEGLRWLAPIVDALDGFDARGEPVDRELADWLRFLYAYLLMQVDDFTATHHHLEILVERGVPSARAHAAGLFAFLNCRQYSDRTPLLVDLARSLVHEHELAPSLQMGAEWAIGCLALYEGRYTDAPEPFGLAVDLAADMAQTNYFVMVGLSLAASEVIAGDPQGAIDRLDAHDWSRSIWDSSPIVRAFALIELGAVAEAADLVITFGHDALRGRLSRMANDALVGLAALAANQGADEHAWNLLQQAVSPRSPFTIALAEWLAETLGYDDQLRQIHRTRRVPLNELDATPALRAELDRIRVDR